MKVHEFESEYKTTIFTSCFLVHLINLTLKFKNKGFLVLLGRNLRKKFVCNANIILFRNDEVLAEKQ